MSARPYEAEPRHTYLHNKHNVFRDDQMYVECHSSDLARIGICKYLNDSTPSAMIPLGKERAKPMVVVIGDSLTMDEQVLDKAREFYLDGILRAASTSGGCVVDSGLASGIGVCAPKLNHHDYCRNVFQMGISPSNIKEILSLYHTQNISMTDFNGWKDRPDEFAAEKFDFIRRLAGGGRTVCILFNAGYNAFEEVYAATQAGIVVILVQGSGELAYELAGAFDSGSSDDPKVMDMINSSCLDVFDMNEGRICDLAALIRVYATCDVVAMRRQVAKAKDLEVDSVWFNRGAPQMQLRVREGADGRLKFINSGKTSPGSKKSRHLAHHPSVSSHGPVRNYKKPTLPKEKNGGRPQRLPPKKKKEEVKEKEIKYDADAEKAVTKIAAVQRGKVAREEIKKELKERDEAATKIQRVARGKAGKERMARKRKGKPLDLPLEEENFDDVVLDFDSPIMSKYRKDGFWCEIMHVAEDEENKKLLIRIRCHGIGTWLDLPKACTLKQGVNQKSMKLLSLRPITKQKTKHEDGQDKIVMDGICTFLVDPSEKKFKDLKFKLQAGYDIVGIPKSFFRDLRMFKAAGPMSERAAKSRTNSGSKKTNSDAGDDASDDAKAESKAESKPESKPEGGEEPTDAEVAAAIKMEAVARGNHDRKMVAQMKADKAKLMKSDPKMTEEKAAIKLEAMARGNRDREKVRQMKAEKEIAKKTGMTEEEAAIKIEAMQRGKQDRAKVQKMKEDKAKAKAEEETKAE